MFYANIFEATNYPSTHPKKTDIARTGTFNVVVIRLKVGDEIPPHPEPYGVFFLVKKGSAIFSTKTAQSTVQENEGILYQPGSIRGITPLEDLVLLGIQDPH
jgi:quercetin dioxygenase-like cupin family protein